MHLLTFKTIKKIIVLGVKRCIRTSFLILSKPTPIRSTVQYLWTLQLARYYSYCLRVPIASELAHRLVAPTYITYLYQMSLYLSWSELYDYPYFVAYSSKLKNCHHHM